MKSRNRLYSRPVRRLPNQDMVGTARTTVLTQRRPYSGDAVGELLVAAVPNTCGINGKQSWLPQYRICETVNDALAMQRLEVTLRRLGWQIEAHETETQPETADAPPRIRRRRVALVIRAKRQ